MLSKLCGHQEQCSSCVTNVSSQKLLNTSFEASPIVRGYDVWYFLMAKKKDVNFVGIIDWMVSDTRYDNEMSPETIKSG